MLFWTKDEFSAFIKFLKDRPVSYTMFMTLYYTSMREGELLALTPSDIDFDKGTLIINKSYQCLNGKDIVSSPKTPKSNRVVTIPEILKATLCATWINATDCSLMTACSHTPKVISIMRWNMESRSPA